jgi:hypothetical protein
MFGLLWLCPVAPPEAREWYDERMEPGWIARLHACAPTNGCKWMISRGFGFRNLKGRAYVQMDYFRVVSDNFEGPDAYFKMLG